MQRPTDARTATRAYIDRALAMEQQAEPTAMPTCCSEDQGSTYPISPEPSLADSLTRD